MIERICPECGDAFTVTGHSRQVYCRKFCKQRAWRNHRSAVVAKSNARRGIEVALEPREGACPRCDLLIGDGPCWICEAERAGKRLAGVLAA